MSKTLTLLKKFSERKRLIYSILLLSSVVISAHLILIGLREFWGGYYTHYNNYVIFKSSFVYLVHSDNLYVHHREQFADLLNTALRLLFLWVCSTPCQM
jgi:hypothetical protein